MTQNMNYMVLPVAAVVLPAAVGFAIFFTGRNKKLREFLSLTAALLGLFLVATLYFLLMQGNTDMCFPICLGQDFTLCFRADWLGMFFAGITSFLWLVSIPYSLKYMEIKSSDSEARFFGFLALSAVAAIGVTMAGNMLTLFIFYELLTVSTYPLVIHAETPVAVRAAKKYLTYLLIGEMLILFAVLSTPGFGEPRAFSKIGVMFPGIGSKMLLFIFFSYIVGFGIKAAIFPFSNWLPTVSVAPTPVTGLLHAVAVVNVGVYGIMRVILNVFGVELTRSMGVGVVLIFISGATIVYGSLMALSQDNLKKRLAFSTVDYVSYSILGVSLLNPAAFAGALLLLVNHAFLKLALFFCAGAVDIQTGKTEVSELSGVGCKMPFTSTCFAIGSLGLIGVPLTLGFVGKWYLWRGPLETNQLGVISVLIAGAILCAFYLLYVVYILFFGQPEISLNCDGKLSWLIRLPIGIGVAGGVVFGVFPKLLILLINPIISCYFGG